MRDARRCSAALLGAVFVLAACSSEPESTAPTVELSTTTVTTLPPTTETTEAPTTTEDPRIAEVEAAVEGLRMAQIRVLLEPETDVETLGAFAVGDLLQDLQDSTLRSRADGRTFEGGFSRRTVAIDWVSDSEATLTECGLDGVAVLGASDEVVVAADEVAVLREVSIVRSLVEERWLVSKISFVGEEKQECEL